MVRLICLAVFTLISTPAVCEVHNDMQGSRDYSDFPRVKGTHITGYAFGEYDAGTFINGANEKNRPLTVHPEGMRTRIVYLGTETQTSLQLLRNYQKAFARYGEYSEVFSCRSETCPRDTTKVIWGEENRVPTQRKNLGWLYQLSSQHKQNVYVYGTIAVQDKLLHVSAFAAVITGGPSGLKNIPIVHLEILEVDEFEAELEFVDANKMISSLASSGSVALYGIEFDFDSATLKPSSSVTVAEIAKVLHADPELAIYVVGHTDSHGRLEYNRGLSKQRAQAVVAVLSQDHGIAPERLTGVGVGPVAPLASNTTELGRQANRRVEIVKK
jgi:OmpA-OmpF porin, OOP family